ncbi:COG2246 Predicted membrane protein [Candidatus Nanopelagicaceae bacterium]
MVVINSLDSKRNFLLYILIGGFGVTLDTSIFLLLNRFNYNYLFANFAGYSVGTCCSFLLNRKYNFKKMNFPYYRFLSFITIAGIGFTTSFLLLYFLVNAFDFPPQIAKFFTLFPVILLQFKLNRRYSFR